MFPLTILTIFILTIHIGCSMYHLMNFHANYPDARIILANCGETVSLSCQNEFENNSSSMTPTMWFRLYENAYPQPLILGDRQLIDDQRFMLRTQHNDRHLEIFGVRKDDQGYYLCKSSNGIQSSYNLTIHTNSCIDIIPDLVHTTIDESIQLICRIHSIKNSNEVNFHIQWTRNGKLLTDTISTISNYSSYDQILYDTLTIKNTTYNDMGIYQCQFGEFLTATAQVIINQYPGGSKSRRLISQLRGNNSSSGNSLRTVVNCFDIVSQIVLLALVARSKQTQISRLSIQNKMFYRTIIALFICILAGNIHGSEKCPGASNDSHENFKLKYDRAPIVAYGEVTSIRKDTVTFTVKCTIKGSLTVSNLELTQLPDVLNETECHYLKDKKQYVVFLESTTNKNNDGRTFYRLADMEEIEINNDSSKLFLDNECDDEEDSGIDMTIFYYNNNLKCNEFTATCNQTIKESILDKNYSPLTKDTTFLVGYKKTVAVPKQTGDGSTDISGKTLGGTGDEQIRNSATMVNIWMPSMAFIVLIIKNIF